MAGRKLGKLSLEILSSLFESRDYDRRIYYSYANVFYNLKRGGYVQIKKDKKNQSFFHLTPRGRLSALKYLHLEKIRKKWDGHWRIIIFDIPEDEKKWRERLRFQLKALGFHVLQESVYITPYPVPVELDKFLDERGFRKYFRYITVAEIDGEKELKEEFGL